jgi:hypothetical protein
MNFESGFKEMRAIPVEKFRRAFVSLLEGAAYARHTNGNSWEYAVEISRLRQYGLCENDLRFLVRLHLVDHATETTCLGHSGRRFEPTGDLFFTDRTCFVLTPTAIDRATSLLKFAAGRATFDMTSALPNHAECMPSWDTDRHLLSFGGQIVKHFKWQAANQEKILSAFQEEGWPSRIDDPLAPMPDLDIKRRLSDTIKCLNRKQANKLLHFHGDGSGQGVIWKAVVGQKSTKFSL